MEITLVRHGPVDFDNSRWLHRHAFGELVREYSNSQLILPACPEPALLFNGHQTNAVVCSTQRRSIQSVYILGFSDAESWSDLDEADLPYPDWLFVPVPYQVAVVVFRIAWFAGYSRNARSRRSTKQRAERAALRLDELAQSHTAVAAIGHGIMNRFIRNALLGRGWQVVESTGSGYWSTVRLNRTV